MDYQCPRCLICGKSAIVQVTAEQYMKWQLGGYIQDVFADKSPDEREMMISGTHPKCWNAFFAQEDTREVKYPPLPEQGLENN